MAQITSTPERGIKNPYTQKTDYTAVKMEDATQVTCRLPLPADYTKANKQVQADLKELFLAKCLELKSRGKFVHQLTDPYISPVAINVKFTDTPRITDTVDLELPAIS